MFENRRMPNGTSEPSLWLCGVGGRARKDSLYPIQNQPNYYFSTLVSRICMSVA